MSLHYTFLIFLNTGRESDKSHMINHVVHLGLVAQRCSVKKVLLEISQNQQENTCTRVSFSIKLQASACNFIERVSGTLAQVFSCEFCEISENTFSHRTSHLWRLLLFCDKKTSEQYSMQKVIIKLKETFQNNKRICFNQTCSFNKVLPNLYIARIW